MLKSRSERRDREFREFVLGCQPRVLRFAELLTRDRGHAEDLAQHGFAKAYAAWEKLRAGNPESYVRRCVVNAQTDRWRRGTWRENADSSLNDRPSSVDHAASFAERDSVMRALARLTLTERAVIALRYYNGLTETEIAHELGIPAGTVKSTAARAIRRLRADADLQEPDKGYHEGVVP